MNITDFNDLTLAVNRVRNLAVVIMSHGARHAVPLIVLE